MVCYNHFVVTLNFYRKFILNVTQPSNVFFFVLIGVKTFLSYLPFNILVNVRIYPHQLEDFPCNVFCLDDIPELILPLTCHKFFAYLSCLSVGLIGPKDRYLAKEVT